MKEITFFIDYNNNKIEFSYCKICFICFNTDTFKYKDIVFYMQSDVEKDLEQFLKERSVDITIK